MAELLVVGTLALDDVRTPFGEVTGALGGSATYFAYAASFFTKVRLVAVVGRDFPKEHLDLLEGRGVDLAGVQVADGRTFRWSGEYGYDLNEARTLDTQLGVLADFRAKLPERFHRTPYLFLANIDPEIQRDVLHRLERPRLVALDTMNYWIRGKREALDRVLAEVDVLLINEAEARMLADEPNLVKAARAIVGEGGKGPRRLVVKRGEYGALLASAHRFFFVPAFPLEAVFDPTGAGDTFAGGALGALARSDRVEEGAMREAIVYGSVMASFTVEDFSLNRLRRLTEEEIEARVRVFREMMQVGI